MNRTCAITPLLSLVSTAALTVSPAFSATDLSAAQACPPLSFRANVEVAGGEFSLADLLAPSACPAALRTAAQVRAGSAPLAGSVRVLDRDQVRALLQKIASHRESNLSAWDIAVLPERITVRRAGARASCGDIGKQMHSALVPRLPAGESLSASDFDCAAGGFPKDSPLALTGIAWNPAQSSWEVSARCVRAADCVPFRVRVHGHNPQPGSSSRVLDAPALGFDHGRPLVRPGQTVTLTWDEAGIRLVAPAVCLEAGGIGQNIRARILGRGRVVRALVVDRGRLRAGL